MARVGEHEGGALGRPEHGAAATSAHPIGGTSFGHGNVLLVGQYLVVGPIGAGIAMRRNSFRRTQRLAMATITPARTRAPAARSPGAAFSASLWLMPFSQGTKIMPVGQTLNKFWAS